MAKKQNLGDKGSLKKAIGIWKNKRNHFFNEGIDSKVAECDAVLDNLTNLLQAKNVGAKGAGQITIPAEVLQGKFIEARD